MAVSFAQIWLISGLENAAFLGLMNDFLEESWRWACANVFLLKYQKIIFIIFFKSYQIVANLNNSFGWQKVINNQWIFASLIFIVTMGHIPQLKEREGKKNLNRRFNV